MVACVIALVLKHCVTSEAPALSTVAMAAVVGKPLVAVRGARSSVAVIEEPSSLKLPHELRHHGPLAKRDVGRLCSLGVLNAAQSRVEFRSGAGTVATWLAQTNAAPESVKMVVPAKAS